MSEGDPELAAAMKRLGVKPPVEKILRTDFLMTALNREKLGPDMAKRIVILACGHYAITRNMDRAKCMDCHKMIMSGEDYEAFRNRGESA